MLLNRLTVLIVNLLLLPVILIVRILSDLLLLSLLIIGVHLLLGLLLLLRPSPSSARRSRKLRPRHARRRRGSVRGGRLRGDRERPPALRGELPRLELLLEHRLPNPPSGVREPVLELLLVDPGLLHEHGLILGGGVRVGEVLRT